MAAIEGPIVAGLQRLHNSNGYAPAPVHVSVNLKDTTPTEVKAVSEDLKDLPTAKPEFELEEHPIDEVRPIKVGVIGAGLAGVTAGALLPAKLPGLDLRIYDKNADVVCLYLSDYCMPTN